MNTLTGLCAVLFAILAPTLALAGLFALLGASGPVALATGAAVMIGGFAWVRR